VSCRCRRSLGQPRVGDAVRRLVAELTGHPGPGFLHGHARADAAEGHPNTLAPGKRPRTTLSPTLAIRDERSRLAFGTPGGDQQDQWSLTFFVRLVAGDRDMQQLIDLPMFHTTSIYNSFAPHGWTPGRLVVEDRLGSGVALELSRRGHDVEIVPGWSLGRLSAVEHDLDLGLLRAAANPRGMQGYAVGR
jgi:gamma-glutamyltranspeptidase/glutathione hydrolase